MAKPRSFKRQIHREADVIAAVEDELTFGLVHEAVAGACLDRLEGLGEIEPAALGQHQCLAIGHEMDEGEHVGDDLDHRRRAQWPHVDDLAAHRCKCRAMHFEQARRRRRRER